MMYTSLLTRDFDVVYYFDPFLTVQAQISMNGSAQKTSSLQRENTPNVAPAVPLSPPRYIATTVNNNNISVASKEHTEEQMNNIKKYQVRSRCS